MFFRFQIIALYPWEVLRSDPPSCEAPRQPTIYSIQKLLNLLANNGEKQDRIHFGTSFRMENSFRAKLRFLCYLYLRNQKNRKQKEGYNKENKRNPQKQRESTTQQKNVSK